MALSLRRIAQRGRAAKQSRLLGLNPVLREVFRSGHVVDESGAARAETAGIQLSYAEALYGLVLARRPRCVIEVGMAYGVSSLAILTALREAGEGGRLISIDPNQRTTWRNVGSLQVRRAGLEEYHTLLEEPDYLALPELLRSGTRVDLAYIDGWHTFDYTLLDWWYIDKMLEPGGVVGFNDCKYRAVQRVISFLRTHRAYQEIELGLSPDYLRNRWIWRTVRRWTGWTVTDRYFEKLRDWEPDWNFYARF